MVNGDADCVVPVDAGVCSMVVAIIEEVATGEVPADGWDSTERRNRKHSGLRVSNCIDVFVR